MMRIEQIPIDQIKTYENNPRDNTKGIPLVNPEKYREEEKDADREILQSFLVSIICEDEGEKEKLREMIGESGRLRRLYIAEEIRAMQ